MFERHPDRAALVKSRLAKEKEELKGLAGKNDNQNEAESLPRQTGSLEWRQARGEMGTGAGQRQ